MSASRLPFVQQPDGWRGRAERLLDGVGRQRLAIAVIVLLALVAGGLLRLHAAPRAADPSAAPLTGGVTQSLPRVPGDDRGGALGPGGPASASGEIAVDVVGRVRRPGLVRLPAGSRVVDAIAAAGGAAPGAELEAVNLARKLVDGEQIRVPRHGEPVTAQAGIPGSAGGMQPGAAGQPGALLDLNTATVEQLDTLPGVGEVTAQRIIAYRDAHPFTSVDDLRQVSGIGDRRFEVLKDLVTVSGGR
jgi:competence protein ComEA